MKQRLVQKVAAYANGIEEVRMRKEDQSETSVFVSDRVMYVQKVPSC